MKELPEDGCLEEITAPPLNHENIIIIQRSGEHSKPGETTYTLATLDRTKEGFELPGDLFLEKIIPGLPKVKAPEVSIPEVTTKTSTQRRPRFRANFRQRPAQRGYQVAARRPRPFHQKLPYIQPENSNTIEPWVHKPWENQPVFSGINTSASVSIPSLSNVPFNAVCVQNSLPPHRFGPNSSSNDYNFPKINERNTLPVIATNMPLLSSPVEILNRPTSNRMPCGSFQTPEIFHNQHSDRDFSDPVTAPLNIDLNGPTHNTRLLGKPPISRFQPKSGLLGDFPFSNMPFKRNLISFPNNISVRPDSEVNTASLLPINQEHLEEQNNFISNTTNNFKKKHLSGKGYDRNSRHNFDQYNGKIENSCQNFNYPHEYSQDHDDFRKNSFRDSSETTYSRFNNSSGLVNHFEDQYKDSYNHLDYKCTNSDSKNLPSKKSRDSYQGNFRRFKKKSPGISHSNSEYMEVDNDEVYENNFNKNQRSNTFSFMSKLTRTPSQESLIHISDSAVVYNPKSFQNDRDIGTNSRSDINSVARPNVMQKSQNKKTWPKKQWSTNKFANNNHFRIKYNQGKHKFRNWRKPRK